MTDNSEQFRHECEVRHCAAMELPALKEFMAAVKKARPNGYARLRADVLAMRKGVAEPEQKSLL